MENNDKVKVKVIITDYEAKILTGQAVNLLCAAKPKYVEALCSNNKGELKEVKQEFMDDVSIMTHNLIMIQKMNTSHPKWLRRFEYIEIQKR